MPWLFTAQRQIDAMPTLTLSPIPITSAQIWTYLHTLASALCEEATRYELGSTTRIELFRAADQIFAALKK